MDLVLSFAFLLACFYSISRMVRGRDVVDLHLGVLAIFAIGYYPLPVVFKSLSGLDVFDESVLSEALAIHGVFFLMVMVGVWVGKGVFCKAKGLEISFLDAFLARNRLLTSLLAFPVFLSYVLTQDVTSYAAEDFEAFFSDRGGFFAIIAAVGNLALALLASNTAALSRDGKGVRFYLVLAMMLGCVAALVPLSQRLAVLSPIVMLLASYYVYGRKRQAVRGLGIAILVLLMLSPVAIYLREGRIDRAESNASSSAYEGFSYGDNPLATAFQSILDRSDLIYVTVSMKPNIDAESSLGLIYYASVFLIPVPRIVFPDKPYVLSSDGTPSGEISIWSWKVMHGGTGSLTAFGGLTAYREAGWIGVLLNGLFSGGAFVFLARWLGAGGSVARVFYAQIFVLLAVKKVPPSFFEILAEVMGMLPFLFVLWGLGALLRRFAKLNRS